MEFHFTTKLEEYYQKFVELQDKLKKSEEQRFLLEMKFNEMVQVAKEEEQAHYKKLRSQYKRFLEEDKKRQDRNERIIRNLERIETRISLLSAKTERINILRRQYQNFLLRTTESNRPRKVPNSGISRERSFIKEKPLQEQESALFRDEFSLPKTVDLKKPLFEDPPLERDRSNDEKIEILDKYLQSISSQRCRDLLSQESEAREKLALGTRPDGFLADDAPSTNHATVIADDIMNSIYLRYYNKIDDVTKDGKLSVPHDTVKTNNLIKTTKDSRASQVRTVTQESLENREEHTNDIGGNNNEQKSNKSKPFIKEEQNDNEKFNMVSRTPTQVTDEIEALNGFHPYKENVNSSVEKQSSQAKEGKASDYSEQKCANETNNYDQTVCQKYNPQCNEDLQILSSDRDGDQYASYDLVNNQQKNPQENIHFNQTEPHKNPESYDQKNRQHTERQGTAKNIPLAAQLQGTNNHEYSESQFTEPYYSEPSRNYSVQQQQYEDYEPAVQQEELNQTHETGEYQSQDQTSPYNQNENGQPIPPSSNQNEQLMPVGQSNEQISYNQNQTPIPDGQTSYNQNEGPMSIVQSSYDPKGQVICDPDAQENEELMPVVQPSHASNQHEPAVPIRQPSNGQPILVAQPSFDQNEQSSYDHNGQPMPAVQPNEQPTSYSPNEPIESPRQPSYDQYVQPIQVAQHSFDHNEQPTIVEQPSYDHNEQPSHDHNEQPNPVVQPSYNQNEQPISYDPNGPEIPTEQPKSVLQPSYDEKGQPMPLAQQNEQPEAAGQALYDENEQPLHYDQMDPSYVQQYNENGQPIEYDQQGQAIEYDPNAQLTGYDQYGQPYLYDAQGQMVQPQYDENGQMIPQFDENGQMIILYDQNGHPYTGDQQQYDENGQTLVQYGEDGQPIYQQNYDYTNQNQDANQYGNQDYLHMEPEGNNFEHREANENENKEEEVKPIMTNEGEVTKEPTKIANVMDILDTDTEVSRPDTSKISNDTDFDFS